MTSNAAQWLTLAAPIVAGAIAVGYGLVFALSGRDKPPGEEGLRRAAQDLRAGVRGFTATASTLAIILLAVIGIGFAVAFAKTGGGAWRQMSAYVIGAVGALLCAWIEPAAGGRRSSALLDALISGPGGVLNEALRRASASGLFAFGLALLSLAGVRALSASRLEAGLLALGIGAACGAVLLYGAGIAARGVGLDKSAPWLPEFFGAGLYAIVAAALGTAMILGRYHFDAIPLAPAYPLTVASGGAIAALIGLLAVRSRGCESAFGAVNRGLILALLISAGLTYLLRRAVLPEAGMFSTVAIGLGTAFILSLLAQHRPSDAADAAAGIEAVVLAGLIAAMALGIAFRLAGGFGVGLCATGLLAAGPFAGMLAVLGARAGTMRALSEGEAFGEGLAEPMAALTAAGRNARLAAGTMLGAAVLLTTAALFRLAMQHPDLEVLDLDHPYVFSALVFGATAPFLLGGLALRSAQRIAERWEAGRAAGTAGAAWRAVWRMFWLLLLAAGLPVAVGFFWGLAAVVGLIVGLTAGALFALFASHLSDRAHGLSGVLAACASPLLLLVALVAVRFGEGAAGLSATVTRAAKIQGLVIAAAALALWLVLEALVNWGRRRPPQEPPA